MTRIPVYSTNLKSIGYEIIDGIGVLEVEFRGGDVYHYSDVPEHHFTEMVNLNANKGSVGGYFNAYVRVGYRVERVPEPITAG